MGRSKRYTREGVLLKAVGVFWENGFAETSLLDLEQATGVNKSGLYSEFKDKKDLFLESLRYYLQTRGGEQMLSADPLGWTNIQRFLEIGETCYTGRRGCFSVNSLRDVSKLPPEAREIVDKNNARLRRLIIRNIKAESSEAPNPGLLADMILTFFAGLCIEQNLQESVSATRRRVAGFMDFIRHPEQR